MTRRSWNPAVANTARNSATVRSWPPSRISIWRSRNVVIHGPIPIRDYLLDHEQPSFRRHSRAAGPQDAGSPLVVEVVEDPAQQIGVTARGHTRDEVTACDVAPLRDTGLRQLPPGLVEDVRLVEQHAAGGGVRSQDRRDEAPVPASHVHDGPAAGEVVGGRHCHVGDVVQVGHHLLEAAAQLRMRREVAEEVRSEYPLKARSARLQAVQ